MIENCPECERWIRNLEIRETEGAELSIEVFTDTDEIETLSSLRN